jgi:RNA polymerase sigma-70 factor (ECF subfamily)
MSCALYAVLAKDRARFHVVPARRPLSPVQPSAASAMTLTLSSFGIDRSPFEPGPPRARPTASLVERSSADHAGEFSELFLRHYTNLCEFVDSYVRAPDVAEEIVQAVFLRLWESRDAWEPRRGPRAYLFGACRNQALDYLRHEEIVARTAEYALDYGMGAPIAPLRADAELEAAELGTQLRNAVACLPERRRLVVVLRWQHQLTNPEIAKIMGISVKGVEMQFSRALADLRRELGGDRRS